MNATRTTKGHAGLGRATIARRFATILVATSLLFVSASAALAQSSPSAQELFQQAENSVFPDSFEADVTLITKEGDQVQSQMELSLSYRHDTGSYMEVNAPSRSRGLRFLQIEDSLWMYNPRAGGGRAIRLSPRSSFQGSAFSNRDLSDPEFADDYTVELAGSETIDHPDLGSVDCWILEANARDDSLAYARIRMWITQDTRILVRSHYFAKSGMLFKQAQFRGIQDIAGARRPTVIEMRSEQQRNLMSTMEIANLRAANDLPDRIFTQRYLTR